MKEAIIYLEDANIYQKTFLVLSEVNLVLDSGDFAYLIGKTGTGKTTLLKVLYGEIPLKEGEGKVADMNLKKMHYKEISQLRRKIGIIFQDFQLLTDRSVYENLIFVLKAIGWKSKEQIDHRIDEVLESVNMLHKKNKMPHEISGGEQQRIAIARALLNKPSLILADEPTGNLDPETSEGILTLLRNVAKENDCAILMATHDYNLIEKFPAMTIKCEKGRVYRGQSVELFS